MLLAGCGLVPGSHGAVAPAAVTGARNGGVLTVGISRPAAVDPGSASESSSRLIASTMCDTLLNIDPKTNAVRPGLVESWLVSEQYNATDIVLKIRRGQKFSDGTEVNAKAIQRSLSRLAMEDYASPVGYLLSQVGGYQYISGEKPGGSNYSQHNLGGVQITDPYGLEIYLRDTIKVPSFLRVLANPATAPISQRQVDNFAAAAHRPVCSGPYKLAGDWQPTDSTIRLVKTPGYHGANPGLTSYGAGYANEIDFKVYGSPQQRFAAFQRGEIDMTAVPLSLRAQAAALPGDPLVEGNDDYEQYIGLPFTPGSPFASPAARIAVSEALDRTAIVHTVYGDGRAPATGLMPPALGVQFKRNACGSLTPATADVAAAQKVLAAGHVASLAGKKVNFYYADGYANGELATAVAAQLHAALGVVVTPVKLTASDFIQRANANGGFDGLFAQGWSSLEALGYDSASSYLGPLTALEGGNFSGFADTGWSLYYTRKVESVYNSSSMSDDEKERDLAFQRAETAVCGLMPIVPVAFGRVHYLVRQGALGAAAGTYLSVRGDPLLREIFVRS